MAIQPKSFLYEHDRESSIVTITLNRPDRLNALTFEVYEELRDTFRNLNSEAGVRAVVLTGSGRGFCSGGDVEDIIGALFERDFEQLLNFTALTASLILSIRECKWPVVAALNGTVAGAGAVIAAACDFRIAAPTAKIAFLFTRVGLSGADMGASWLLPRLVGFGHATHLLMTGEFIDAQEAQRIGLYTKVVDQEQLLPATLSWANNLAALPSFGLSVTKNLLNREATMDLVSALDAEAQIQAGCMLHPNFRENYDAFKEKRSPRFV